MTLLLNSSFILSKSEDEIALKSAFLFNFTKYVEWENGSLDDASSFKIGVVNDPEMIQALRNSSVKKIKNKKVEIIQINSIDKIQECHLFFFSASTSLSDIKSYSTSKSTRFALLVAERKNALNNGAAINLVKVSDQLKFEINLQNFNKNKLKVSSQLLQLAITVYE